MRRALAMMAVCVMLAGGGPDARDVQTEQPDRNAETSVAPQIRVRPYVDPKTGVEWLVFRHYAGGIAVVQRQPLPAPPSEGE